MTTSVFSSPPTYRARVLMPLYECGRAEAFAINADGIVVGTCWESIDGVEIPHATIWFPCTWFSGDSPVFSPWVPYDLGELSGQGLGGEAFDISDDRVIVGYQQFMHEGLQIDRPFVWDLSVWIPDSSGGSFRYQALGDFSETDILGGRAHGVNNLSPPMIVGHAFIDPGCFGGQQHRNYAFAHRWLLTDPTELLPLEPASLDDLSDAYAVTTSYPFRAVGNDYRCASTLECGSPTDSVQWRIEATVAIEGNFVESNNPPAASTASDINESLWAVGWQTYDDGGSSPLVTCRSRATYWEDLGSLTDLHYPTGFTVAQETLAYALTQDLGDAENPLVYVVGEALPAFDGVVWEGESDTWSAALADTLLVAPCSVHVRRLNDINDSLWTVGTADAPEFLPDPNSNCPTVLRAVLLYPDFATCFGDVDGDQVVDAKDLAALLGAWGPWTDSCEPITPDLDGDGVVGAADLAMLLGAWGTDCCMINDGLVSSQQSSLAAESSGEPQFSALQVLGFSTITEFTTWFASASDAQREAAAQYLSDLLNAGYPVEMGGGM